MSALTQEQRDYLSLQMSDQELEVFEQSCQRVLDTEAEAEAAYQHHKRTRTRESYAAMVLAQNAYRTACTKQATLEVAHDLHD